jgi:hypothetical protein
MEVGGKQIEQACQAFLSAFDYAQLERFLYFRFEKELGEIAPSNSDLQVVCYKLVRQAEKGSWFVDLIREATDYDRGNKKLNDLARDLHIKISDPNSATRPALPNLKGSDTSGPLTIVEDFRRDLEKIKADQSWRREDYEHQLELLKASLPRLRKQTRLLAPKHGTDLKQSVLLELQLADAIKDALDSIDAFELCLNYLLDSPYRRGILDRTRYVQWYRSRSTKISEYLGNLQLLGINPEESDGKDVTPEVAAVSLSMFIRRLRKSYSTDAPQLDERGPVMTVYSGIDASLDAVIEYLNGTDVPEECNIVLIRELLINVREFIEYTASALRQLPSVPEDEPLLPLGEGTRLQELCIEAVDGLDLYNRINHALISSWEEAALAGVSDRTIDPGLYEARRRFIVKLTDLQRRVAALKY